MSGQLRKRASSQLPIRTVRYRPPKRSEPYEERAQRERAEVEHEVLLDARDLAVHRPLDRPADPRDRNTPEPPMPKDAFVLKFVKPRG